MTNYKQVKNNSRRGNNQKDGGSRGRKSGFTKLFEVAGFKRSDWNKWTYTWPGEFPVFILAPGTISNKEGAPREGLIARCGDKEIYFPYGTDPKIIRSRLDDEIANFIEVGELIDFDEDWLIENLPKTSPPRNTRAGTEYGVIT